MYPLRTLLEIRMKKLASAALAVMIGVAPLAATTASADWNGGPKGHVYYPQKKPQPYQPQVQRNNGGGWKPGTGVGFAAGALVGVGIGVLATRPPAPVYYAPPPVYYPPPAPVYYDAPQPPPPVYYSGWTEAHVEWCLSQYRSYNPATNTYPGYDGYTYECFGPY
jgi:hypothetical protein